MDNTIMLQLMGKDPAKIKEDKRRMEAEIEGLHLDTLNQIDLENIAHLFSDKIDELTYSLELANEVLKRCKGYLRKHAIEFYWKSHPEWKELKVGDKLLAFEDMQGAGYDDLDRYKVDTVYTVDKIALLGYAENEAHMHVEAHSLTYGDNVSMSVELAIEMRDAYNEMKATGDAK